VIVFPLGNGFSHFGRPSVVGAFIASAWNACAAFRPALSALALAAVAVPLSLSVSLSLPHAPRPTASATVASVAIGRRRKRRLTSVPDDLMLPLLLVG
jgi:hypothetical protein